MHPMKIRIEIPSIPLKEQTPTVKLLLGTIEQQQMAINQLVEEVTVLKEEVKRLKKHKGKPRINSEPDE
jgi:cell division protein FtsB